MNPAARNQVLDTASVTINFMRWAEAVRARVCPNVVASQPDVPTSEWRSVMDVMIAGTGLTPFGRHLHRTLGQLAWQAASEALTEATLEPSQVDTVVFSNAAEGLLRGQEMIRGQVALKESPLAGKPLLNTENACASGAAALHIASLLVASGRAEVVLALGAEKLHHPDKGRSFAAIASGIDQALDHTEVGSGSVMMDAYARQARMYAAAHGVDVELALARVAVKNRRFAADNPNAQFRDPITIEDVLGSREVALPLRLLMCSPMTDGAAAVVVTAKNRTPTDRPTVRLAASILGSHGTGERVVTQVARRAFIATGWSPRTVDVWQLHDASAQAELEQYEDVGLVSAGQGPAFVAELSRGEGPAINTDGGLLSRGHPLGATGLAQVTELTRQLQGRAGRRQREGARTAVAVNSGGWMGEDYAAAVVTALERVSGVVPS